MNDKSEAKSEPIDEQGAAHKFVNSGEERLRQVDIHVSERFVTEWLEE